MKCPNCSRENAPESRFCEGCGTRLDAPRPKPVCTGCGTELKPDAKFCPSCGKAVGPSAPAAAAATPNEVRTAPPPPAPVAQPIHQDIPKSPPPPAPAAPRSSAPPPGPGPVQTPQPPRQSARPRSTGRGRNCCGGCFLLLAALLGGSYYLWAVVLLSRPEAFAGIWELEGQNSLMESRFVLEPVEGGVKVRDKDGKPIPVDITLKPTGTRKMTATLTNPVDPSIKAEVSVELNWIGNEMTLNATGPNLNETTKATRLGLVTGLETP